MNHGCHRQSLSVCLIQKEFLKRSGNVDIHVPLLFGNLIFQRPVSMGSDHKQLWLGSYLCYLVVLLLIYTLYTISRSTRTIFEGFFIISWQRSAAFLLHTVAARQPESCLLRQAILITRKALGECRPQPSSSFSRIL